MGPLKQITDVETFKLESAGWATNWLEWASASNDYYSSISISFLTTETIRFGSKANIEKYNWWEFKRIYNAASAFFTPK